ASRVVQRPTPRSQADDPREFQLSQLRRRYSPKEAQQGDFSILTFDLKPSDPDFPFEIDALKCVLRVPMTYPKKGAPSLRVLNKEMDRGYQINVENGFDALSMDTSKSHTLLSLLNALDRQLETLLTAQKADTIKIMPNTTKATPDISPGDARVVRKGKSPEIDSQSGATRAAAPSTPRPSRPAAPTYSLQEKATARSRREVEIRQLEARLGKLQQYSKLSDDSYVLPVEPRKRGDLPVGLQAIKTVKLVVPELYPLQPCAIKLMGIETESAGPLEHAFEERARANTAMSLMNHVNYLSQNMHVMAAQPPSQPASQGNSQNPRSSGQAAWAFSEDDHRSHIVTIPRPPEWQVQESHGDEDEDSYDSYPDDSDGDEESELRDPAAEGGASASASASAPERGIMLSFPHLELHGIELLELNSLSVTVKCLRCKETTDVTKLRNNATADTTGTRSVSCKKCANALGIGYRMSLMHANSVKAGYLDLDGCTPVDLLTSQFTPTCSECSTAYPSPGVASVRGDSAMAICRECHGKMSFRIAELKFLLVSASAGTSLGLFVRKLRSLPRKPLQTENLGIVAGQELPKRGRCTHYSKSFRWFRFSCCSKVFACDRCHDQESDHPNEHANRMLCGYCSREQNYRPETCGICHATLIRSKGSGFWEGGKGTSVGGITFTRAHPRKYKRRPGTAPRA
ncbi:hypothetical protein K490DRAFT_31585, partial [Saccharata proteae CBS 121410]